VSLAWVPYAGRAEAERRLGGVPDGLELDFYRADGLATATKDPKRRAELDDVGLVRMLSPEQVERKVAAVFGERWGRLNGNGRQASAIQLWRGSRVCQMKPPATPVASRFSGIIRYAAERTIHREWIRNASQSVLIRR